MPKQVIDPTDTSVWHEDYNEHRDEEGRPGHNPTDSPGVNTVLQPNLNNSLIGRVRLEAVKRLLVTR